MDVNRFCTTRPIIVVWTRDQRNLQKTGETKELKNNNVHYPTRRVGTLRFIDSEVSAYRNEGEGRPPSR